jgi:putative nucleotidyltransferase with HDIG domain
MSNVTLPLAQRLLTLLIGAIKGNSFYPAGHPAVKQPLQEMDTAFRTILQSQTELHLGIHDDILFFDTHLFMTITPSVKELTERLAGKKIVRVTIERSFRIEGLGRFINLMADRNLSGANLVKTLEQEGVNGITVSLSEETVEEENDGRNEVLETYGQALVAIRELFKEIEKGRIPHSNKVISVVKNLATLTIHDPSTLLGLAMIKDYDNYTFNHCVNVGVLAMALSAALGHGQEEIEDVGVAGFLHDIGKTKIDKNIINKPGKLTDDEFEEMKKHSEIGSKIIDEMEGIGPLISQAVLGHHIRYNREGYPEWAREQAFNYMSGILAVADCYDAITTLRVYQRPMTPKAAIDRITELSGTILDAGLVTSFIDMMGKYPVGTLVRLDTNEIAVVYRPNPVNSDYPVVKLIFDAHGGQLDPPLVVKLTETDGRHYAEIVAILDPMMKNIEVGKFLS